MVRPGTNSMNSHGISEALKIVFLSCFIIFLHFIRYTKNALQMISAYDTHVPRISSGTSRMYLGIPFPHRN